jgi:hypothetical protein
MTTRRTFMSASALFAFAPLAHSHAICGLPSTVPAGLVVHDSRCGDAAIARAFPHSTGATVCVITDDVSDPWFRVLRPHMLAGGDAVAGISQGDALFCLHRLAADMGWRIDHCFDHACGAPVAPARVGSSSAVYTWHLIRNPERTI